MNLLRNFTCSRSLRVVLGSIVVIPVALAVALTVEIVHIKQTNYEKITQIDEVTHVGMMSTHLVHLLQKERGASAVYLSTNGAEFGPQLAKFRSETDGYVRDFADHLDHFDKNLFSSGMRTEIDQALSALRLLDQKRKSIDALSIMVPDAVSYYTEINANLLDYYNGIIQITHLPTVANGLTSVLNFQYAKELAGLERAVGSSGFAKGSFDRQSYGKFNELVLLQNENFDRFLVTATENQKSVFHAMLKSGPQQTIDQMRAIALSTPIGEPLENVNSGVFFDAQTKRIDELKNIGEMLNDNTMAEIDIQLAASEADRQYWVVLSVLGLIIAGTMAFATSSMLRSRLVTITNIAKEMAAGDLSVTLPRASNNEIGDLIKALAIFRDETKKARDLQEEISYKNQEEAERARADAEAGRVRSAIVATELERTASAIEELTMSVRGVADNMESARMRADKIKMQSEHGNDTVQKAIKAMQEIKQSSSEIRSITSLIDEISFQTNLLALNARVEAARAGEAGRGFAVVAAEVQNLAARSAQAANDISSLIAQSSRQVEEGATIVNKGGEALELIAQGIFEISDTISTVSRQSAEQARAITEINQTTASLDHSMQEFVNARG